MDRAVLNRADQVIVLVAGAIKPHGFSKYWKVRTIGRAAQFRLIEPAQGELAWLLDAAAAGNGVGAPRAGGLWQEANQSSAAVVAKKTGEN